MCKPPVSKNPPSTTAAFRTSPSYRLVCRYACLNCLAHSAETSTILPTHPSMPDIHPLHRHLGAPTLAVSAIGTRRFDGDRSTYWQLIRRTSLRSRRIAEVDSQRLKRFSRIPCILHRFSHQRTSLSPAVRQCACIRDIHAFFLAAVTGFAVPSPSIPQRRAHGQPIRIQSH
ncbi:hypothetical protein L226DRAFT_283939 [Lentinus tigrinus ALCF2SS1-7]|uniref:uncharacterized protein n=1 Tax=Lentinus tigrinus ALCF2SS1-7 TaxID=1328758 RepID=UPI001165E52A|nr:hypothetical protein L226DRAFT_283939 [Lentinus tigrinus ALCF2SS1-7]